MAVEIQAGGSAGAPESPPPALSAGDCFEPETPARDPPLPRLWGQGHPGVPTPIVPERFGRAMAAAAHHVSPGAQCRPRAPSKPRSGPPPATGARGGGGRMLGEPRGAAQPPSAWPEHRHRFPWLPPMEAVGRKMPAGPAPRLEAAIITLVLSTPSPIKPPLPPAALPGHRLPKATQEHPWCHPPPHQTVLCSGDDDPPCCTGTRDRNGQHHPRHRHSPLLPARETLWA